MCGLFDYDGTQVYLTENEAELEYYMTEDIVNNIGFVDVDGCYIPCVVYVDINSRSNNIVIDPYIRKYAVAVDYYDFFRIKKRQFVERGYSLLQIMKDSFLYGWTVYNNNKKKGIKITFKLDKI